MVVFPQRGYRNIYPKEEEEKEERSLIKDLKRYAQLAIA